VGQFHFSRRLGGVAKRPDIIALHSLGLDVPQHVVAFLYCRFAQFASRVSF
jgi:hypothetical protein